MAHEPSSYDKVGKIQSKEFCASIVSIVSVKEVNKS